MVRAAEEAEHLLAMLAGHCSDASAYSHQRDRSRFPSRGEKSAASRAPSRKSSLAKPPLKRAKHGDPPFLGQRAPTTIEGAGLRLVLVPRFPLGEKVM